MKEDTKARRKQLAKELHDIAMSKYGFIPKIPILVALIKYIPNYEERFNYKPSTVISRVIPLITKLDLAKN